MITTTAPRTNSNNGLLDVMLNRTRYHREHEKYYARAPLTQAGQLREHADVLKTLADHWVELGLEEIGSGHAARMEGCEDLNEAAAIQQSGALFMEGEGEPAEIGRPKRALSDMADDYEQAWTWLGAAMESSWESARRILDNPALARRWRVFRRQVAASRADTSQAASVSESAG